MLLLVGGPVVHQPVSRWVVWAGPGVVARVAIAAFRNPSPKTKARLAVLREEPERLAEELPDDPDQLEERLPALHSGRRMAALWVPPAVTVMLLVVFKLTLGPGAHAIPAWLRAVSDGHVPLTTPGRPARLEPAIRVVVRSGSR